MPRPFARVAPTCALITVALSFSPSSAQSPPAPSSADARLRVLTRCGAPAGWSSTPAFISFGWTREQAMSYLRDRAPLAEHEITTEIDR